MPTLSVEVGDNGDIGTLPPELQKFLDKRIGQVTREEREKAEKRIEDARKQAAGDPEALERLKSIEAENSRLKEAEATRKKNYEEAQKIRDERYANDLKERDERIAAAQKDVTQRTERIVALARNEVRSIAAQLGARPESLDELVLILGPRISLNEHLESFVTDAKDASKPGLDADGKPFTVEGFVGKYLADHPHHKSATPGRGGGGRGGRSTTGDQGTPKLGDAEYEALSADPSHQTATAFMSKVLAGAKP